MGGLISKLRELFSGKKLTVILVGLENSGKTTLVNTLSSETPGETVPTIGLNVKKFSKKGTAITAWDLGGQKRFRGDWNRYTVGCDTIIFMIDASDAQRIPSAKKEFHQLLEDRQLSGIPVMVALNKVDIKPHLSREDAVRDLNLDYVSDNPWVVAPISALHKINLESVLDWLLQFKKKK